MQKRIGPQQDGAVGSFFDKKRGGPKGGEKRATSHRKRTVNSCYNGRMMVDPLGVATVPFLKIKDESLSRSCQGSHSAAL